MFLAGVSPGGLFLLLTRGGFLLPTALMRAVVSGLPGSRLLVQQKVILLLGFATLSSPSSLQAHCPYQ